MEVGALEVVLGIEAAEFLSGLGNAQKALTAFVTLLADMGKEAVSAASEAQAVGTKLAGIFKEATPGVVRFSEELAKSAGRSTTEVSRMVASFGEITAPLVKNRELAASMSEELAAMAINMAKATHQSDQSAMESLSAGLRGSTRALREFGIDLSPTALKLAALKAGFSAAHGAMNQAQMTLLRETVIMQSAAEMAERAAKANGNFSEQTKELSAHTEELLEKIGGPLMAATASVLGVINSLVEKFSDMSAQTAQTIAVSGGLVVALGAVAAAIHLVEEGFFEEAAAAVAGWAAALGPALLVGAAIAAVGLGIGALIHVWRDHAAAIKQAMGEALQWVQGKFALFWDGVKNILAAIRDGFFGAAEAIVKAMGAAFEWLQEKLGLFKDIKISAAVDAAVGGMEGARQSVGNAGEGTAKLFAEGGKELGDMLVTSGRGLMDAFHYAIDGFKGLFPGAHASTEAPRAGTKGNLAANLRSLATPKDSAGAGGAAAAAATDAASAAWFAAQTSMSERSHAAAKAALQVAQDEAIAANAASQVADAYLLAHKHSKAAAEAARDASLAADDATSALAAATQAYADRLQAESDAEQQKAAALQDALSQWKQSVLAKVTPSALGNVVQGAAQGAAVAGPIGGVIGGIAGALSSSQQFQQLMQGINGIIVMLMSALNPFFKALQPLIGAVGMIINVVGKMLTPIFAILAKVLEPIVKLVEVVANIFSALAPVFKAISDVISKVLQPVIFVFKKVLEVIGDVLKVVASVILIIFIALGKVWNWLVQGIQDVINWFVDAINSVLGWLGVHVNEVNFAGAKVNVDGLTKSLHDLWNTTDAQNNAAANQTYQQDVLAGSTGSLTKAIINTTDALTNVPAGMNSLIYQLRNYAVAATAGSNTGVPHFASGGHVSGPTLALIGEGGEGESIIPDSKLGAKGATSIGQVVIVSSDPETIWAQLKGLMKRDGVRMSGMPFYGTAPRFAAG